MKVETPQILWNSEDASKGLPAALMGVTLIESGLTVSSGGGVHGNTITPTYCLATAGNCNNIHLWKVEFAAETNNNSSSSSIFQKDAAASTKIDFLCALTRHEGPVNAVKFSPDGLHLATASDTGSIIVWSVPVNKRANANGKHYWSTVSKENTDLQVKIVARAMDGVTDISWSNDSKRFVCGTIDHCVMVFEDANYSSNSTSAAATVAAAAEWKIAYRSASNHSHYVQGVAYDPSNVYLASQSSDRTVRVLSRKVQSKKKVLRPSNNCSTSTTCTAIPPAEHAVAVQQLLTDSKLDFSMKTKQLKYRKNNKDTEENGATTTADGDGETAPANTTTANSSSAKQYLYAAETTLESFVRRLAWTVDGAYLITPAAVWNMTASVVSASNDEKQKAGRYATLVYQRHRFEEPWKVLGGLEKPSIAVRPNPVLFQLPPADAVKEDETKENCSGKPALPYRSIFAVLTWDSVLVYDTVHDQPLAVARGLHYANLVDATWTPDGRNLVVCSTDGYISILRFDQGELGEVYVPAAPPGVATPPPLKQQQSQQDTTITSLAASPPTGMQSPPTKLAMPNARPTLPPCEPGMATVECPPAKRAKTRVQVVPILPVTSDVIAEDQQETHKRTAAEAAIAVDKLSLAEDDAPQKKKKKRIQPTLMSVS